MSATATLLEKPIALLDGGLGTTLEDNHGIVFSSDTPLWSSHLLISSPSTLREVHSAFVRAGADIILTATYQASFDGFSKTKVDTQTVSHVDAEQYIRSAVTIARSSFNTKPGLVALSLGAFGATMVPSAEYSGDYDLMTESDLVSFHQNRLDVFLKDRKTWADIDLIAFETLPRLDEIRAARYVASLTAPSQRKPYWISCVFPGEDYRLPDGSDISEVVSALLTTTYDNIPFAIGINCTKVHKLPALIRQFEDSITDAGLPFPQLVIYPDGASDKIYNTTLQKWEDTRSQAMSKSWDEEVFEIVQDVRRRDAWKGIIVGGCCKTTLTHIASLRRRLENEQD